MPDKDAPEEEAARWWGRMQGPRGDASRAQFEEWRAADARNAAEYDKLERTWRLAARLGATELGRSRSLARRPRIQAWVTAPRLALAAAAVLLIALMVTARTAPGPNAIRLAAAHTTVVGEIRTLHLPDGSSVTLDTDTRLELAFDGKTRKVRLAQGRARFEIHPERRPFLVEAGGKIVSAPDAGFDIQLTPAGLCLHSLHGAMEIRPNAAGQPFSQMDLRSGQAVRFASSGAPVAPAGSPEKGSDQWVSGMLVFQASPLSNVLAETNRYSRRRIGLAEPVLGTLKVTGAFRPLPVEALAASLAAAFGLQVRHAANGDLLLARP